MRGSTTEKKAVDALIVSDIHLGLPVSNSEHLLRLFDLYDFKRLVLNGDIFDSVNFSRLKGPEWDLLSRIRELSDPENATEVAWIIGNHDEVVYELMSNLVGIPVFEEFEWSVNGKKFLALHGHQFDTFIKRNPLATKAGSKFYYGIQKIEGHKHRVSRYLKKVTKKWRHNSKMVSGKAIAYGATKGVHFVFCGHTHQAMELASATTNYMNSGSWTDAKPTYITVDMDGNAKLNYLSIDPAPSAQA